MEFNSSQDTCQAVSGIIFQSEWNFGLDKRNSFPYVRAMRTIPEIIDAAGGLAVVAERTGLKDGVRKWPQIGIPDRYWPVLIDLVPGLRPDELYAANRMVRRDPEEAA